MDWQYTLIDLFELICERFDEGLWAYSERFSNNNAPIFTDQEVLTIYLFGIMRGRTTVKATHRYVADHLGAWFPTLPAYQTYNARLNRLGSACEALIEALLARCNQQGVHAAVKLIDSMPVMLAQPQYECARSADAGEQRLRCQ